MEEEEGYIVNLVSQRMGNNLTTSDWEICLNYLRENYDSLVEEVGIDVDKVKSYVSAYTFVEMEKEEPDEKTNYIAEARAAYSPSKVTAYTDRYWNSHNSAYPNFENMGGDCANFASQIMYEGGGFKKNNTWNYCNKNATKAWVNAQSFKNYLIR